MISPWVGLESAKYLETKFKVPLLHYPILPIGASETTKFLRAVQEFTGADKDLVEKVITRKLNGSFGISEPSRGKKM